MKKILFLLSIIVLSISCNKDNLGPCEQIYDSQTLPKLSKTDYNSSDDVRINFCYMSRLSPNVPQKWFDKYYNNPYEKNIGDTIRIKGFAYYSAIGPIMYDNKGEKWKCELYDNSMIAKITLQGTDTTLLKGVDFSKKCYVISTLTFESYIPVDGAPPITDKGCFAILPYFNVVEIKN